jgi:hypothetical protein
VLQGQRYQLLLALIGWAVISAVLVAGTALLIHGSPDWLADRIGADLRRLVFAFALLLAAWSALNLLVTTITPGALAHLLMFAAGWRDQQGAEVRSARADRRAGSAQQVQAGRLW